MKAKLPLDNITSCFELGHLADEILDTLLKVSAQNQPTKRDLEYLERAETLLRQADEGSRWLDSPKISARSLLCADSLASVASSFSAPGKPSCPDRIKVLLNTVEAVRKGDQVDPSALSSLQEFFDNLLKCCVDAIDDDLQNDLSGVGSEKWGLLVH